MDTTREDAKLVVEFLLADPETYALVLIMARLRKEPATLSFRGNTPDDERSVESYKEGIHRLLCSGWFGACPVCFHPTVAFPEGTRINWPPPEHKCSTPIDPPPSTKRKPRADVNF